MAGGLENLLTGRTLVKRYRIEEVIGQGGFAVVYCAEDLRLGRQCAVKVLSIPAPTPELREHLRARFEHEARAAAALPHHPNVVPVYDFGSDPETGIDFIVMELLRGENVAAYLAREGRPPLPLALRILRDATEGIAVGHRAGLIHRDVKPGNLFLAEPQGDQPFRVCVLDFGIARLTDEDDDGSMTRTRGAAPLSPAYASPEQLRGERSLTPATDVYALGVVGYQLLTGRKPFNAERDAGTSTELRPVRAFNPQVTPELEAVITRAMSAEPGDRFRDADDLAGALDAAMEPDDSTTLIATSAPPILDDERTVIAPVAPPRAVAAAVPVAVAAEPPRAAAAPPPSRKGRGWMVALPILALGGVAGVWAMSRDGDERPDQAVRTDTTEERPAPVSDAGDEPVTAPLPVDTGAAQPVEETPSDEGGDAPAVTPVPFNPDADGGNPPAASQPSPAPRQSVPAQQPQPQQPQPRQPAQPRQQLPRPQQQRPQPRPELPPQREAPRQPVPTPQQPEPQPQPPAPQPQPPAPQPAPQPLPGTPVPPPPTPYPTPRDTIVIPSNPPAGQVVPR